jgi:hypothetical protein
MDDEERRRQRQDRGEQMAAVRQSYVDEVTTSPSRNQLRDLTDADHKMIEALLRSWLQGVLLGRRMKECKLRLFLTSGRLLNQAEVGSENPKRPPELERSVWTIDTMDNADLPIYGYVASLGDLRDPDGGALTRKTLRDTYGPARLIYQPALRSRSTVTAGDSLWLLHQRRAAPSAFRGPSWISVPPEAGDYIDVRTHADVCVASDFIECQTLGGVYVEDIEQIIFDDEPEPATREALGDRIPWSIARPH